MSLVNALINQIGREIGRDVYQTAKRAVLSDFRSTSKRSIGQLTINQQLIYKIDQFAKSKSGFNVLDLKELVHTIYENVDTLSGDWDDVYLNADTLIDNKKINASEGDLKLLNEIDQLNFSSYRISLSEHKKNILQRIDAYRNERIYHWVSPSPFLLFFFSFFGTGSNLLIRGKANTIAEFLIPWLCGLMIYAGISLNSRGDKSLNLVALVCLLIFFITIIGNFILRSDLMKKKMRYVDEVTALKNYYKGLIKTVN